MVTPDNINKFFDLLNHNRMKYVLIKNDGNMIPNCVPDGNDIDILIHPSDYDRLIEIASVNGYERLPGESFKYFFLYKLRPDIYLHKEGAFFHAYEKIACTSLTNMGKSKIPLDSAIQQYIWNNRVWNEKCQWWQANEITVLIALIVRAIFDKKKFREIYIAEITKRKDLLDEPKFEELCEYIFFKYTKRLIILLKRKKYDSILLDYQHFHEY